MPTSTPSKPGFLARLALKAIHRAALALHASTHRRADRATTKMLKIVGSTNDPNLRNEAVANHESTMGYLQHVHGQSISLLDQTESLLNR